MNKTIADILDVFIDFTKALLWIGLCFFVPYVIYLMFDSYNSNNSQAITACIEAGGQWVMNNCTR